MCTVCSGWLSWGAAYVLFSVVLSVLAAGPVCGAAVWLLSVLAAAGVAVWLLSVLAAAGVAVWLLASLAAGVAV